MLPRIARALLVHALPDAIFEAAAEPYSIGHSLPEALRNAEQEHRERGIGIILDILGESVQEPAAAERNYRRMRLLLGEAGALNRRCGTFASVAVKPTHLTRAENGYAPPLPQRMLELAEAAAREGVPLALDMEGSQHTDATLNAAAAVWKAGLPLSVAMQAMLYRTPRDIERIARNGIPRELATVRLVRGIYVEPPEIALQEKERAKERMPGLAYALLRAGIGTVQFGTHDIRIIDRFLNEYGSAVKDAEARVEFQFLKGVRAVDRKEQELLQLGFPVSRYAPFEWERPEPREGVARALDWLPFCQKDSETKGYMRRRLTNNPDLLGYGIANHFHRPLN